MNLSSRVLIVEDDPFNSALLEEVLGEEFTTQCASSGEEAMEMATQFRPDLVLLDIVLPGIDGFEVCRCLRSIRRCSNTKILLLSGRTALSERLEGYAVGADDYVTKPFDPEELLAKLRVFLRLKSLEEVVDLKRDLFTLLNHETRTPLNGILGPAQILQEDDQLDATERSELTEMIVRNGNHLLRLFERIALLSAFKSEQVPMDQKLVDLVDLVRGAIERQDSSHPNIRYSGPETVKLPLDQKHVLRSVEALLENAIEYGDGQSEIQIRISSGADHAELSVTNRGAGIELVDLPFVFDELSVRDGKQHAAGNGLSLAILREVVEGHGGSVEAASNPGEETTFTLRFPLHEHRTTAAV